MCFPSGSAGKESACNTGDTGDWKFDPRIRKIPWRRKGNPLQYYCLENTMDRGSWWATVHGVAKSQTRPIDFYCVSRSVVSDCLWPMDCSLPGSSVHRVSQARILEWVAIPFSRESSQPRGQTQVSQIADGFFTS